MIAEFLLRLLIASAIFVFPFMLFVIASRRADSGAILMIPFIASIPAALAAALLFVPVEQALDRRGLDQWATPAVILAGASVVIFGMLWKELRVRRARGSIDRGMVKVSPDAPIMNRKKRETPNFMLIVFAVLGAIWGGAWRLSADILHWVGGIVG